MKRLTTRVLTVIFITTSTLVNAQDWATKPGTTWDMTTGIPIETTPKQAKPKVPLVVNRVDEFTGNIEKSTEPQLIGGPEGGATIALFGAYIGVVRVGSVYTVTIKPTMIDYRAQEQLGCAGAVNNFITFLFQDGTTLTLNKDLSRTDCSTNAKCVYDISGYRFKPVKKIRVKLSNGSRDIDWSGKYSMQDLVDSVK